MVILPYIAFLERRFIVTEGYSQHLPSYDSSRTTSYISRSYPAGGGIVVMVGGKMKPCSNESEESRFRGEVLTDHIFLSKVRSRCSYRAPTGLARCAWWVTVARMIVEARVRQGFKLFVAALRKPMSASKLSGFPVCEHSRIVMGVKVPPRHVSHIQFVISATSDPRRLLPLICLRTCSSIPCAVLMCFLRLSDLPHSTPQSGSGHSSLESRRCTVRSCRRRFEVRYCRFPEKAALQVGHDDVLVFAGNVGGAVAVDIGCSDGGIVKIALSGET